MIFLLEKSKWTKKIFWYKRKNFPETKEYTRSRFWGKECMKKIMNFSKIKPVEEWRNGNRNGRKPNSGMISTKIPEQGNMNTIPGQLWRRYISYLRVIPVGGKGIIVFIPCMPQSLFNSYSQPSWGYKFSRLLVFQEQPKRVW